MDRVSIENGYRVTVPKDLREGLKIGDQLWITTDRAGRIILVNEEQLRATLKRTAGLWAGRKDVPTDGVKYVNRLRRGRRLKRLEAKRRASRCHRRSD